MSDIIKYSSLISYSSLRTCKIDVYDSGQRKSRVVVKDSVRLSYKVVGKKSETIIYDISKLVVLESLK